MHEELGLDIDLSTEGGSDSYRDVGQEANAHYTSSHPENFTSINTDSVPIINSLQHFVDNFHKINSFDDKNEKRKSSLAKRAETKDLKLYMLEQDEGYGEGLYDRRLQLLQQGHRRSV